MSIFVEKTNKTKFKVPVRRFFVLMSARALKSIVFKNHKPPRILEVSLIFVSSREMRHLNKKHRREDELTDVLSFPHFQSAPVRTPSVRAKSRLMGKIVPMADPDGVVRLGEIIIAPEAVSKEATLFGHTVFEHYMFLFVHGFLHLLGYDHEKSKKDEHIMQKVQSAALKILKN
ncbi:MAG: rRNA maturation RNase YbeY [bacterium]|nr:rRNA maturation RNase YbeY [bacterium]